MELNTKQLRLIYDVHCFTVSRSVCFIQEGKQNHIKSTLWNHNTCRITINQNPKSNQIGTQVWWYSWIGANAYGPSPTFYGVSIISGVSCTCWWYAVCFSTFRGSHLPTQISASLCPAYYFNTTILIHLEPEKVPPSIYIYRYLCSI